MSDKPLNAVGFDSSRGVGKHDFVKSAPNVTDSILPERQPFWGYCASCKHEWIVFYAPIDLYKVAEIGKRAICPVCGETKVICGKAP